MKFKIMKISDKLQDLKQHKHMTVLVTGAGGFVGLRLVKVLSELGFKVHTLQRGIYPELNLPNVKNFSASIGNKNKENQNTIDLALNGVNAIFHVASKIGMWGEYLDYYQTNVEGTEDLVNRAKERGIKYFVYTSTPSVVFDQGDILGFDESLPYPKKHLNYYGKTKRMAEEFVLKSASMNFISAAIRPHLIFGPGDKQLIPKVIKAHQEGRLKMIGDGNNLVDVSYIDNVIDAHLKLFLQMLVDPKPVCGKAYFIGQRQPVKLWEFTNTLLSGIGLTPITKKIPVALAYGLGFIIEIIFTVLRIKKIEPPMTRFIALQLGKSHYFSHQNAINDFGYEELVTTEEGLNLLIDDYRSGKAHIL